MDRYKSDFEAVRDRTAVLRAAREATEATLTPPAPLVRKSASTSKRKVAAKVD